MKRIVVAVSLCLPVFANNIAMAQTTQKQQQVIEWVAMAKAIVNECSSLRINLAVGASLFEKHKVDLKNENGPHMTALRNAYRTAKMLADAQNGSEDAWCDKGHALFGPSGSEVKGLLREK